MIITNNAIYDVDGLKNKIQKVIKETKTDDLGRIIKEEIKDNNLCYVQEYTYLRRSGSEQYTSFLVETTKQLINNAFIKEIKYSYDNLNRVTKVQERYNETSSFEEVENYTYDKRGYLVEDNDRTYEYDDNGNITKNGSTTLNYQTIKVGGVTKNTDILKDINYSAISSVSFVSYLSSLPLFPNSYKHLELTYEGKNLIKVRHPSGEEFTYSYNFEGLRIKRSGNRSETVTYSYSGNKLILQESSSLKLEFLYDEKDNLYGYIKNNNERYYYIRDALGNILGIINQNGQIVVQYSYTAYGVCSISGNTSLGNENPFRYKGYYYDVETSLYYLNTRYYDPEIGRFISPDSVEYLNPQSINGLNLYAYCFNDPINYADPSGNLPFFILTAIIGAVIGVGITAAVDYIPDKEFDLHWGWYVGAGVLGAAIGTGIGMAVSYYATGSIASSTGQVFTSLFKSTSLYRSVGPDELTDLKATGNFRQGPNSMEGKFFANSKNGAMKWGKSFNQSSYVKIRVPKNSLSNSSVNAIKYLDAIDDAFYFSDLGYLNSIAGKIWFL
ncbi:MAG: RHS repeat-associated core domain-containing protein [Bacilli bacterium]|nr:RHS repeat-associated core domain-containing protein [Bacilli bacterium]